MDRALRANVITKSGKAVETAGDIDVLLLDKTGTITIGNRKATNFYPSTGVDFTTFVEACALSSLADETPEGKSIVELAGKDITSKLTIEGATMIKFTAETRSSGVNLKSGVVLRKGAYDAIKKLTEKAGYKFPAETAQSVTAISSNGGTPLVVSENDRVLGVIELQDIIKPGIQERFERLRKMGVKTVMVTGDNPLTAKYIAEKAGVDDFIAEAKPEDKMNYIRKEQQAGKLVAMMGDGTNDAPALAQADVGVAMNSGTQAKYFNGRPSAVAYNAAGSGGSNKGPSNPDYLKGVQAAIDSFMLHNPGVKKEDVPVELVTMSGSGLDPDISPKAALVQVPRIAKARHLSEEQVTALVNKHIDKPWFGPAHINVLLLNVDLDKL